MKRQSLFVLVGGLVALSLVLAACAPAGPARPYDEKPFSEPMVLDAGGCDYGGAVRSVEAVDEFTVVFNLCGPDPAFLSKMAFSVFGIYPQEWLEWASQAENVEARLGNPIGTGPYMVESWVRGESLTLTANPDYWGQAPKAKTFVLRWSTESAARVLELKSGTVSGIDNPGPSDFATIEDDPNLVLVERPALNTFYIAMTNTFEPWDNVNVRRAIAMGIDRQRIVDNFYPRGSEVASHFTPCAIPNGCTGEEWYEFDAEAARALLAEAGLGDGFSTQLFYRDVVRGYLPEVPRVAEEIQAQLKANLNIDAEIVVMESGAFIEESTAGRLDGLYLLGWGADYPHVTNFLDFHFGQANPQFGTTHPEIYEVLQEAAQVADPDVAEPLYVEANNAIKELIPMVPVAHGGNATGYLATVDTPQASPLTEERFAFSSDGDDTFVFMQNAEPISLFCADETDGESLRGCTQIIEGMYAYVVNGTDLEPALASSCDPNEDLSVWTCHLREGVKFHDGTSLDANDVVATFTMGLDAASPLHQGSTNAWEYYSYLWVSLINAE